MHWMAIGFVALLAVSAHAGETGTIMVLTTGGKSEKGTVVIQLANSATDYKQNDNAFRFAEAKPKHGRATFTFESVPYGTYAIKVFHDENDNRKLDVGMRGPTERYGFSNGARGLMGPPKFEDAKFTLSDRTLQLEINLK
jgi:uncharacterized protein (DUF2141 family)